MNEFWKFGPMPLFMPPDPPAPPADPPAPPADPPAPPADPPAPPADPPAPPADPPAPPADPPKPPEPPPAAGYSTLVEGLDEDGQTIAKQFTDLGHIVTTLKTAQDAVSKAVIPPGKDSSAEDIAKYRKQMGVPKEPIDYKLKVPEKLADGREWGDADTALATGFLKVAHEHHAPPALVQAVFDWFQETQGGLIEAGTKALVDWKQEQEAALKQA